MEGEEAGKEGKKFMLERTIVGTLGKVKGNILPLQTLHKYVLSAYNKLGGASAGSWTEEELKDKINVKINSSQKFKLHTDNTVKLLKYNGLKYIDW